VRDVIILGYTIWEPVRMRADSMESRRQGWLLMSEDYWMTRPELSKRIRVPEKTLAMWPKEGKGPRYAKFGRHVRYRLSDVIAWENAQFGGNAA
jgi:hypothetical protein